jgi:ribulose bisphosphate carboxylase small subunit
MPSCEPIDHHRGKTDVCEDVNGRQSKYGGEFVRADTSGRNDMMPFCIVRPEGATTQTSYSRAVDTRRESC